MKHAISLLLVSVAYGGVIRRQVASPVGLPSPGDLVGGSLQAAGSATSAAGEGLKGGGPITDLPSGILKSVGSGLSSAGQAAKGSPVKRQAVGDVGGIVGGLEDSWYSSIPGSLLESIGAVGLVSAGKSARGSTGNPRLLTDLQERQAPSPADIVGSVGSGLSQGAAGASSVPGSGIVDQVGQGLQQGAKGAKDSTPPKMMRRQATGTSAPGPAADLTGGALQAAGGITEAVGEGLKGGGPITAPAGGIVDGIAQGLAGAGDAIRGTPKSS